MYTIDGKLFYSMIGGNEIKITGECKDAIITEEDRDALLLSKKRHEELNGKDIYLFLSPDGIPKDLENKIRNFLLKPGYFGRPAPGTKNLMWSIYKMFLREKVILNHKNLILNSNKIIKDYSDGMIMQEIVKKYDQPPANIYRVILMRHYGINNSDEIKNILKGNYLPKRNKNLIRAEIKWINENDVISGADQDKVQEKAAIYEKTIGEFLENNGVSYETQETILLQQMKEYGKAIATPDFLLTSKVYINNCPVSWIDAKHSYGGNMNFIKESLTKQVKRYNKLWGYGALFFSGSFAMGLQIPGALLITYEMDTTKSTE